MTRPILALVGGGARSGKSAFALEHARSLGARRTLLALRALRDVDVVVIDCLTLWLSNLLLRGEPERRIAEQADQLCQTLRAAPFRSVVVTNEVGMGIVPESALGRVVRDLAGSAQQRIARSADQVYLAAVGCVLRVQPAPFALAAAGGVPCPA